MFFNNTVILIYIYIYIYIDHIKFIEIVLTVFSLSLYHSIPYVDKGFHNLSHMYTTRLHHLQHKNQICVRSDALLKEYEIHIHRKILPQNKQNRQKAVSKRLSWHHKITSQKSSYHCQPYENDDQ